MTPTKSCTSLVEKLIKFTILILSFAKLRSPESKNVRVPWAWGKFVQLKYLNSQKMTTSTKCLYMGISKFIQLSKVAFISDFGLTFTKSPFKCSDKVSLNITDSMVIFRVLQENVPYLNPQF